MERGPRVGTVFAGYRIDAVLGQGGMGVVYRAAHPRLGSAVAIKVMDPRLSLDEVQRARFLHEAHVAASLNHPHVIPILDAGCEGDELYIVMRCVDGDDLGGVLRSRGPLDLASTSHIVRQAGGGLDAAHARGLVHRDVKPANLLLEPATAEPSAAHLYVADFGLVAVAAASGVSAGTADYMAPEQIEGGAIDARTDVYALGCVAYQCLCGIPPFPREAEAAVLWAQMQEDPSPPTSIRSELPSDIDGVIAQAMAKQPADRYPDCEAFAADLAASQAGSGPSSQSRRRRHVVRRARRAATAAVVVFALIAVGIAIAVAAGVFDGGPAATPPQPRQRNPSPRKVDLKTLLGQVGLDVCARSHIKHDPANGGDHAFCVMDGAAGGVADLRVWTFAPLWGLLNPQYLRDLATFRSNDPLLPSGTDTGPCGRGPERWHTEYAWKRPGHQLRVRLSRNSMHEQQADGRVVCWTSKFGTPELEWTLNDSRAYLIARLDGTHATADQHKLYDWWVAHRDQLAPIRDHPT